MTKAEAIEAIKNKWTQEGWIVEASDKTAKLAVEAIYDEIYDTACRENQPDSHAEASYE